MKIYKVNIKHSIYIIAAILLYYLVSDPNDLNLWLLYLILSTLIIVDVAIISYKKDNIVSFNNIANLFSASIFIIRPIQLYFERFDLSNFILLNINNKINRSIQLLEFPIAQAGLIGLLGIYALNIFFLSQKSIQIDIGNYPKWYKYRKLSKGQKLGITLFIITSFGSAIIYLLKSYINANSIHIYDMLWIFLFSIITIYIICFYHRATFLTSVLLIISIAITSLTARRQFIVNFLLCYIIPIYYVGENKKRRIRGMVLVSIILIIIVSAYGRIRAISQGLIGYSYSRALLSEFSMYEMLLVTLKQFNENKINYFWGYNYLTIFTLPISSLKVEHFDHMLTRIVFSGILGGGNPISIFGSLFLNFSYMGVMIGSLFLGWTFTKVQNKLALRIKRSYDGIGYYALFSTFVYDIIRVGNIGREIWMLVVQGAVFFIAFKILDYFSIKRGNKNLGAVNRPGFIGDRNL
jgi:hypothetical protein